MDNADLLSAEDNLFGRVALYNKLVEPAQVAECTRMIFVEAVANLPRRSLGEIMVAQCYLSPQVAKSIAEAVRKKLASAAAAAVPASGGSKDKPAGPAPTPAARPAAPAAPPTRPKRAKAGDSQVLVRVESGAGPGKERIWVEAPAGGDAATVKVACSYLYPTDAKNLAAACRQLLELKKSKLVVDMREVDYVPSVILGEIAKVGIDSWEDGRKLTLLAQKKVAAVAEMVMGKIVAVVGS